MNWDEQNKLILTIGRKLDDIVERTAQDLRKDPILRELAYLYSDFADKRDGIYSFNDNNPFAKFESISSYVGIMTIIKAELSLTLLEQENEDNQ